jgi:hypothetical protein
MVKNLIQKMKNHNHIRIKTAIGKFCFVSRVAANIRLHPKSLKFGKKLKIRF